MNLSPSAAGRIDDNLAAEYARLGKLFKHPGPVEALPANWLKRF